MRLTEQINSDNVKDTKPPFTFEDLYDSQFSLVNQSLVVLK